ncbi:hypothetical protein DFJ74DRAFT_763858 [Hyaloraphidium curvatum]|nr:hypothetical protein DFJ74DRAFT_763858 [Hyaloraphidium curvatum]
MAVLGRRHRIIRGIVRSAFHRVGTWDGAQGRARDRRLGTKAQLSTRIRTSHLPPRAPHGVPRRRAGLRAGAVAVRRGADAGRPDVGRAAAAAARARAAGAAQRSAGRRLRRRQRQRRLGLRLGERQRRQAREGRAPRRPAAAAAGIPPPAAVAQPADPRGRPLPREAPALARRASPADPRRPRFPRQACPWAGVGARGPRARAAAAQLPADPEAQPAPRAVPSHRRPAGRHTHAAGRGDARRDTEADARGRQGVGGRGICGVAVHGAGRPGTRKALALHATARSRLVLRRHARQRVIGSMARRGRAAARTPVSMVRFPVPRHLPRTGHDQHSIPRGRPAFPILGTPRHCPGLSPNLAYADGPGPSTPIERQPGARFAPHAPCGAPPEPGPDPWHRAPVLPRPREAGGGRERRRGQGEGGRVGAVHGVQLERAREGGAGALGWAVMACTRRLLGGQQSCGLAIPRLPVLTACERHSCRATQHQDMRYPVLQTSSGSYCAPHGPQWHQMTPQSLLQPCVH